MVWLPINKGRCTGRCSVFFVYQQNQMDSMSEKRLRTPVIPAKAGIQLDFSNIVGFDVENTAWNSPASVGYSATGTGRQAARGTFSGLGKQEVCQ